METRCPECQTVFRVAEEQLAVADGQVRCGECQHVFNAREHFVDTQPGEAEEQDNNTAETDDSPADATATQEDSNNTPRGYDVAALYPELGKAPAFIPPPGKRETLAWSAVILLLIVVLFAQLTWFNRDSLAKNPKLRPMMESLCASLDCELVSRRAPALVRLQQHKVLSHPKHKEALRVEAIIVNEANFIQAYPVLRLRFRDLDGRLLATREFLPKEYLPTDVNRVKGMTPGEPVNTVLDIIDPGKKAISYEFDFL